MRHFLFLSSLVLVLPFCGAYELPQEDEENTPEANYTDETAARDTRTKKRYENQDDPGYRNRSYADRNVENRNAYLQGENQFPQQSQYNSYNTYGNPNYPVNPYPYNANSPN